MSFDTHSLSAGPDLYLTAFGTSVGVSARPLYGEARPADVQLDGQTFDLIWCGSLLTHLDVPAWREFVDFFETALIPGGLLVVTSHGRGWAEILKNAETGRGQLPDDDMRKAILRRYEDTGFGYADYDLPDDDRLSLSLPRNYGTSLAKPSWVCQFFESRARLRLVTYMENRWGGQDVLAFIRLWNS